ncbi:transposase [Aminithiophilus ramosus]|uniref:Transposase n=1 Tax=Aminithiophilus ramosus TaxID=3029084 RepID=A0A9Q7EWR1_9BACT|nr:transposase [Aminithiophilus ramosus]QTX33488.1 transposase [Aminithiophilus ramosus]
MNPYSPDVKEQLVKRMMPPENASLSSLARETGISFETLRQWRKQARIETGSPVPGNGRRPQSWSPGEAGETVDKQPTGSYVIRRFKKAFSIGVSAAASVVMEAVFVSLDEGPDDDRRPSASRRLDRLFRGGTPERRSFRQSSGEELPEG